MNYVPVIQSLVNTKDYQVDILRLDLMDEEISGNKWFKLKYNIEAAKQAGLDQLITFGGAFSNHLAATAAACKKFKLRSVAIIRGEEPQILNPTLSKAKENGMHLHFVSRDFYDKKEEEGFKEYLLHKFGEHYFVPEGGNNEKGIRGCMEIIDPSWEYDYILCACGTAATYTGILASLKPDQKVIGISVLKGENILPQQVRNNLANFFPEKKLTITGDEQQEESYTKENCILSTYAMKGYARLDEALVEFKNNFERAYKIVLDHVYTVKLLYATFDLLKKNKFKPSSKLLIIHSGGIQGNKGFEERYHLKPNL